MQRDLKPTAIATSLLVALALFVARETLSANGGGYSEGGVSETGTIHGFTPAGTEAVQIEKEELDILLRRNGAEVDVRYDLRNLTAKAAKVRFGFPIEELRPEYIVGQEEDLTPITDLQYCRNYQVTFNVEPVRAEFEAQPNAELSAPHRRGIRGWLVSSIRLEPEATARLRIRFEADYTYSDTFVSDDGHEGARKFLYRLSTGGAWAGPIAKGRIVIRTEGIPIDETTILGPAGRFKRQDSRWIWEFKDLEPTLADDLVVEAVPERSTFGGRSMDGLFAARTQKAPVTFVQIGDGSWYAQHSNFSKIVASSTLPDQGERSYRVENVTSRDPELVWSEGAKGSGSGEWIEATLEVPKPLRAIEVLGGYADHFSESPLFKANARPKEVEFLLNDEFVLHATLRDEEEWQEFGIVGYDKPVRTVKMLIRSVYPGTKWEDCVVSGLRVMSKLDKKPEIEPAR